MSEYIPLMRVISISSVWIIFGIFLIFLCIVSLRLGLKASYLTETDIIVHYTGIYLENERAQGRAAQPTDCYALASTQIWERMEVICAPENGAPYSYLIGLWGQLLQFSRSLNIDFVLRA